MFKKNIILNTNTNDVLEHIEYLLQKHLKTFLIAIFVTSLAGSFYNYLSHHPYKVGDWLINYQGGFVRRGFLGEVVYQLSLFTNISPGFYIFIIEALLYFIFLYCSYLLLKKQKKLLPFSILIVSPFIFTFQVNDLLGGYRKEIIYIATIAFITWAANFKNIKTFEKVFYIVLLLYPLVILTHEMLAIYLPYLIVVYISTVTLNKTRLLVLFVFILLSIYSFFYALSNSGNEYQVHQILFSLNQMNYAIDGGGAISWLTKDSLYGINKVIENIDKNHYYFYLINIAIAVIAFAPFSKTIENILKNKLSLFLVCSSIIGSLALFIVAVDWGRFIYVHLVSFFFLLFLPTVKKEDQPIFLSTLTKKQLAIFFTAYSLFWHIPHAGSVLKKTFTRPNFIEFFVPYAKIVREIYRINKKKSN